MSKTAFYTRFYTADTSGYGKCVLSPIYQKKKTGQALYSKQQNDNDRSRIKTFRDDDALRAADFPRSFDLVGNTLFVMTQTNETETIKNKAVIKIGVILNLFQNLPFGLLKTPATTNNTIGSS